MFSFGVVAMGVVNVSIVGMGIFSAGLTTMGLNVWSPQGAALQQLTEQGDTSSAKNILAYSTHRIQKKRLKKTGWLGVHKIGELWMHLRLIQ